MNRHVKQRLFHAKASAKGGKRNGVYYRSKWEFNYSLALDSMKAGGEIRDWKYEDTEFEFKGIKRGTRFYRPDFHVFEDTGDYFVECKGFLDAKSITALTRMAKYYPDVTVLLVDKKKYCELESDFGHLEGWER